MANIKFYQQIVQQIQHSNVRLVAVSKTKPETEIMELYQQGQRVFGENRVQELVQKQAALPKDIQWHLIGHLQTNKVKYVAPFVSMIHAVDSLKLLKEINRQAQKHQRVIDCLLQFHIAEESTKFGLEWTEAEALLESDLFQQFQHVRICGVMGMASFVDDESQVRTEFQQLKTIFDRLKRGYFKDQEQFKELSMGMSGDYPLAIEEGSTMIRVGSLLFGSR